MEPISALVVAWLMSSAALGVGSSTLAIASFLVALADGNIDQSERRMLGVIYTALRAAMAMIAMSLLWLNLQYPEIILSAPYIWFLWAVLVLNAILMTKRWISFKIGPALQAGTWYTLGFVLTIDAFSLLELSWKTVGALYAVDIIFSLVIVNALLMWSKSRTQNS